MVALWPNNGRDGGRGRKYPDRPYARFLPRKSHHRTQVGMNQEKRLVPILSNPTCTVIALATTDRGFSSYELTLMYSFLPVSDCVCDHLSRKESYDLSKYVVAQTWDDNGFVCHQAAIADAGNGLGAHDPGVEKL